MLNKTSRTRIYQQKVHAAYYNHKRFLAGIPLPNNRVTLFNSSCFSCLGILDKGIWPSLFLPRTWRYRREIIRNEKSLDREQRERSCNNPPCTAALRTTVVRVPQAASSESVDKCDSWCCQPWPGPGLPKLQFPVVIATSAPSLVIAADFSAGGFHGDTSCTP